MTHSLMLQFVKPVWGAPPQVESGTGFLLELYTRRWLVTCWHCLASTEGTFDGSISAIAVLADGQVILLEDRAIVGCRLRGLQLDVAAVELGIDEHLPIPAFVGSKAPSSYSRKKGLTMFHREPVSGGLVACLHVGEGIHVEGFPSAAIVNQTAEEVYARRVMATPDQPGTIAYLGAFENGYSGAPVVTEKNLLAGIHYAHADGAINVTPAEGARKYPGRHSFYMGLAVDAGLLLAALPHASVSGVQVIDVDS